MLFFSCSTKLNRKVPVFLFLKVYIVVYIIITVMKFCKYANFFKAVMVMHRYFGFVERQSEFAFCGAAISVAALFYSETAKTDIMIINCKDTSKTAALIPPQETENIKNYIKSAVTDFCADYYDTIYYDRWFSLDMVFKDEYYYKQKPTVVIYRVVIIGAKIRNRAFNIIFYIFSFLRRD